MHISTPNVIVHNIGQNMIALTIVIAKFGVPNTCGPKGNLRKVSASYVCASDKAQRRK